MKMITPPAMPYRGDTSGIKAAGRTILFGAGLYAEPALFALRQHGIEPEAICDNSPCKQGGHHLGLPVLSPAQADLGRPGTAVVICSAIRYLDEIQAQCRDMGAQAVFPCVSLFSELSYRPDDFSRGVEAFHIDTNRYLLEYFAHRKPEILLLETLDIVVTERCSLRCRDCSNLMQYYPRPKDIAPERLLPALDRLMESIDHLMEFRVLGGETFMNREVHRILEHLNGYRNASRIIIYSNGTILPNPEDLPWLKRENTLVRITDYGGLSRNLPNLTNLLQKEGIDYTVETCTHWQDCASIGPQGLGPEQLAWQFAHCQTRRLFTLLKDSLYQCPFAANASNLGAIPKAPGDRVPLDGSLSRAGLRQAVRAMLWNLPHSHACAYCPGRHMEPSIPSAIQIDQPRPYRIFP